MWRAPPAMHTLKMLRFWDNLTLNNSPDTKYSWMPQIHPTGRISISSVQVSAITPVSVHDIQQKGLILVFMLLLIPMDITMLPRQRFSFRARVIIVQPFDHLWHHQRSHESCDNHYDTRLIYRIQKSLLPRTINFSQWPCTMFRTLPMPLTEVLGYQWVYYLHFCVCHLLCRWTNGVSQEVKK